MIQPVFETGVTPQIVNTCEPGIGVLEVARRGARSVVTRAAATSPLRLLTPGNHGSAAWVYAATYGGGLVDGDDVRLGMSVGPDAMAMLSTQASTKVYRSIRGATMALDVRVAPGGFVALLPDPVVPFAASTYSQTQRIDLGEDASLVIVDLLSSGRRGAGERWRFDSYTSRIEVHRQGRLAMLDALTLSAEDGNLERRMGRFNVLCTLVLIGAVVRQHAGDALARVSSLPVMKGADLLVGASPAGQDGAIVRIAGASYEGVAGAARQYLSFVPPLLGDDPWARKW